MFLLDGCRLILFELCGFSVTQLWHLWFFIESENNDGWMSEQSKTLRLLILMPLSFIYCFL